MEAQPVHPDSHEVWWYWPGSQLLATTMGPMEWRGPHCLRSSGLSCRLFILVTDLVVGDECFCLGSLIPRLRRREICFQWVELVAWLEVLIHLSLAFKSLSQVESLHWILLKASPGCLILSHSHSLSQKEAGC